MSTGQTCFESLGCVTVQGATAIDLPGKSTSCVLSQTEQHYSMNLT